MRVVAQTEKKRGGQTNEQRGNQRKKQRRNSLGHGGIMQLSWGRIDHRLSHWAIVLYCAGVPTQNLQRNKQYQSMRKGAAASELARKRSARSIVAGYGLLSKETCLVKFA